MISMWPIFFIIIWNLVLFQVQTNQFMIQFQPLIELSNFLSMIWHWVARAYSCKPSNDDDEKNIFYFSSIYFSQFGWWRHQHQQNSCGNYKQQFFCVIDCYGRRISWLNPTVKNNTNKLKDATDLTILCSLVLHSF